MSPAQTDMVSRSTSKNLQQTGGRPFPPWGEGARRADEGAFLPHPVKLPHPAKSPLTSSAK
jgi:hypothetical protein